MALALNIKELLKSAEQPFNVIEEFSALSPKRKVLLCDHLFVHGRSSFENTVRLLWPEASAHDLKRLAGFLSALKKKAH